MKTVYVVWKWWDGHLESETIEIEGKINHYKIMKEIREIAPYHRKHDAFIILSWQVEEPFTDEEYDEFFRIKR